MSKNLPPSSSTPNRLAKDLALDDLAWEESILHNSDVLQKSIPWDRLGSGGIVEMKELELLKRFLPLSTDRQDLLLQQEGDQYGRLFINLVSKLAQPEHLQYILALIDTFLTRNESLCSVFLRLSSLNEALPYDPFLNHLRRDGGDWFINAKVSNILGLLLVRSGRGEVSAERISVVTRGIMKWFSSHLTSSEKPEILNPLLLSLRTVLRSQDARIVFDEFEGIDILGNLLRSPHHPIIYNSLFCLWLLSYNSDLIKRRFPKTLVVSKIVEIVKNIQREKVIRISIAILKNLVEGSKENSLHIIESGFMKLLPNLLLRKWGDEELESNLTTLDEILQQRMSELGSWDMYKNEILSGNLEWNLIHKNDRFWRENISRFAENEFQIVGVLIDIINKSENPLVLAVALNDIGRFVKFHPAGRTVLQGIPQAKMGIMTKLNHHDNEVQKQSLLAIQKLMVSNWEFLNN